MKAIVTKYLGQTEKRPARIVATADGGHRVVVTATGSDPHRDAVIALCHKLQWTGELVQGGLPGIGSFRNGEVFVFLDQWTKFKIPTKGGSK